MVHSGGATPECVLRVVSTIGMHSYHAPDVIHNVRLDPDDSQNYPRRTGSGESRGAPHVAKFDEG